MYVYIHIVFCISKHYVFRMYFVLFGVNFPVGYFSVTSLSWHILLLSHYFICVANLLYDMTKKAH